MTGRQLSPFALLDPARAAEELQTEIDSAGGGIIGGTRTIVQDDFTYGNGVVATLTGLLTPYAANIANTDGTPRVETNPFDGLTGGWAKMLLDSEDEFQVAGFNGMSPRVDSHPTIETRVGVSELAASDTAALNFLMGSAIVSVSLSQPGPNNFFVTNPNSKTPQDTGVPCVLGQIYKIKIDLSDKSAVKYFLDDVQIGPTFDCSIFNDGTTMNTRLYLQKADGSETYVVVDYITMESDRYTGEVGDVS